MKTFISVSTIAALVACGLVLAGCASGAPSRSSAVAVDASRYGTVQSIERLPAGSSEGGSAVAGTLIGGAVGAAVGNQFGDGKGKDIATVAGAVGGAVAGHELQQRAQERAAAEGQYRVRVRMHNGDSRTIVGDDIGDLRVGQEVRVEGDRIWR